MRRTIAFLLFLTLPIALLGWTHGELTRLEDDVEFTVTHIVGDPDAMDGHTVAVESWCGSHMQWLTDYTPGSGDHTETAFSFIQKQNNGGIPQWDDFDLFLSMGVSMSTNGSFETSDEGVAAMIRAVADQTPPGEEKTMTLRMEDYLEYYELSYVVNIQTDNHSISQAYDWHKLLQASGNEGVDYYTLWAERFKFPVIPGQEVVISVSKDAGGNINDLEYNFSQCPTVSFPYYVAEDGMYFSPVFRGFEDELLTTGEYAMGYGIYYIPFRAVENVMRADGGKTVPISVFDFENLELVYALEPAGEVLTMEENGGQLHILMEEAGQIVYNRLDLSTGEFAARLELGADFSYNDQLFLEQELLLLNGEDSMMLVNLAGEPKVEFVIAVPEEADTNGYEDIRYEDGKLYLLASGWTDDGDCFILAMCDADGMHYYGKYQWPLWRGYDYYYKGMKPGLSNVKFRD